MNIWQAMPWRGVTLRPIQEKVLPWRYRCLKYNVTGKLTRNSLKTTVQYTSSFYIMNWNHPLKTGWYCHAFFLKAHNWQLEYPRFISHYDSRSCSSPLNIFVAFCAINTRNNSELRFEFCISHSWAILQCPSKEKGGSRDNGVSKGAFHEWSQCKALDSPCSSYKSLHRIERSTVSSGRLSFYCWARGRHDSCKE